MKITHDFEDNLLKIKTSLRIGESFDVLERIINVHHTTFYLYYLDGFVKDSVLEYVRRDMYNLKDEDFRTIKTARDLAEKAISSIEVSYETDIELMITGILSGQTLLLGPGFNEALLLDFRTYPARGTEEPAKEKVLRGSHDGFVETLVCNTALIRRRIRDPRLTFEMHSVGETSRTDVVIGYMRDKVDKKTFKHVKKLITDLQVDALTMGDQSLVEAVHSKSWFNPFPKVRYTERPDVAAAHLMEGKVIILVDNTPTALILPTNIFDFMQSVDDYYLPVFTGNYLRLVRYIVFLSNLLLTPLFVLFTDNPQWFSNHFSFLLPTDPYPIPIFIQFIILEIAVDGLKLASLNTPDALGASLSIIGGLILGDFAVKTGWFIPHTILYMAVVALSSFTQPSLELSYAFKFARIVMIILTGFWGTLGFILSVILNVCCLAFTKTFTDEPYLYPLIPFNANALHHLLFRTKLNTKQKVK
ncbi:spore germination protein [Sporanaerobium hydrogeniformans]|uniref:Spore germination protein n=1 Tax=Sporanaerobium hydrogeniformans TaxID=3072179 RepID=A0AC61DBT1_9FIRM|nr:spore germination protein [Sporanaerobium hydrogeniformans]PHV70012.1 spore germination protein [Sporanaerobium hydrogeniformans]